MASPLFIAQQIFSLLQKSSSLPNGQAAADQCMNCTTVSTASNANYFGFSAQSTLPVPHDFPSLVTFFCSSILVYGSLLEILRRFVLYIYRRGYESLFITATFKEDDASYSWVCYWLSRQPAWHNARDLEISTEAFGFDALMIEGEAEDASAIVHRGRQLAYLPSEDSVHTMSYNKHWMWVSRILKEGSYGRKRRYIQLRILGRSRDVLNNILIDAKKEYQEAQQNLISVYVSNQQSWRMLATRSKRSFSSIILDPGMKDHLIEDAKDFLSSKDWYAARGIPFRRGYLLYGAPGSGKTSIIHSLAGELGLDVYIISLSKSGMDDTALNELITDLPEKCIALMEDIDAAFIQTVNRESGKSQNGDDDKDKDEKSSKPPPAQIGNSSRPGSSITLSGLLNALDGVGAQEGRILFATTNKYDSLDPALCRPGRMDIHMEFKLASRYQARELFRCFYMPESDLKSEDGEEDEKTKGNGDSGYSSESDEKKKQGLVETKGSDGDISSRERHAGRHSMRSLSHAELEKLAEEFADAIPEREFSMASLQGYLMAYKIRPVAAVQQAEMWVTKEREESHQMKERWKDEKFHDGGAPVQSSDT